MIKILKYSFFDLIRSRWSLIYFSFYFLLALVLLFLNNDISKAIITMMNVIIILGPLIGIIFGIMYYYNSSEFTELLLAQPIKRTSIFIGQFLGLAFSLSLSLVLGLGIPFVFYGLFRSGEIFNFLTILWIGFILTFIFTGVAFYIALANQNRIKGFGMAILFWLFMAVIYDALFLLLLVWFRDYPLDNLALIATIFNPIDLSRIMILLKLDISSLMGYTGAVFKSFFAGGSGLLASYLLLLLWAFIPVMAIVHRAKRKDF
jgi:Cu-processing system permease protein